MSQRDEWAKAIKQDNPQLPVYFINLLLDVYERDAEFLKKLKKGGDRALREFERPKAAAEASDIVGAVQILSPALLNNEADPIADRLS